MITMASMMPPKLEDEQDLINHDIEEETSFLNLEFDRRDSSESFENLNSWDVFVEKIRENEDDTGESKSLRCALRVFKVIVCLLTFAIVLTTAVVSKGTLLFMTSVIDKSRTFQICRKDLDLDKDKTYVVRITSAERSGWIWCLLFVLIVPDIFTFFRSCRICIFKTYKKPKLKSFLVVLLTESLHTIGCLLLVFVVFPSMDVARAITLTNAVCIVPGCLAMISRFSKKNFNRIELVLDVLAIVFQVLGLVLWPTTLSKTSDSTWIIICIPVAAILVSCGWWENFTDSQARFLRSLSDVKEDLVNSRYFVYIFISVFKIILTFLFFLLLSGENVKYLLLNFDEGFQSQPVTVYSSPTQQRNIPARVTPPPSQLLTIYSNHFIPVYVALIHAIASLLCYTCGKFTCKVGIQSFSYSLPVSLTVPVALSLMMGGCGVRTQDPCAFADISSYLFWQCPKDRFMGDFIVKDYGWVWILWIISQAWIAIHIWSPNSKRLASTEKLFVNPMYCSVVIDQSLALNRRKEDEDSPKENQAHMLNTTRDPRYYEENCFPEALESPYISQSTPFIYACATMWHETGDEMELLLKSIFRMDEDQSARKISQFYLQVPDPDYYLLEIHIFFDDAFVISDENDDESVANSFVKEFLEVIHVAASKVHETDIKLKPPSKYSTPYGGRLVWCLPGGNFLYVHLKNKELIRHKKRWSQVMYMYYLLGHRLMDLDKTVQEKTVMAENTYILALDGDIDFRPHAVQLLVDLMNRNKGLGAACGRIHPVGSGAMVYYQKFEYAIGHWLQKATEHMIGCVLCSPGCFSLFRAKALMDDNVAKTYTMKSKEASHYIQFDQGEDRWLCTLLLQRGYRVEYSAASDAYTHCPESFAEFYTQRRRWAPSTMANIMDLLVHYKTTVACNDNISMPYIAYQGLMMIGTILGPGTIFLMLVGAMVSAFQISNWQSLLSNLFPVVFFILICFLAKNDTQIMIAQIFSAAYALLMMAVLVGISLQLVEDGISSPSAIFLLSLTASFLISAIVHPQEFWCVAHGLLYFLSVPSMYLLLALYSLVNLNVVSWGTREVQTKKSRKQLAEEERLGVQAVTVQQAKKDTGLLSWFNNLSGKKPADYLEEDGSVTFGLANLFRCICCTYPKSNEQNLILTKIQGELEALGKQMHNVQRQIEGPATRSHAMRRRSSVHRLQRDENLDAVTEGIEETEELLQEDEYEIEPEDDGVSDAQTHAYNQPDQNQYWLSDKAFEQGTVEYLDEQETEFWKELIKTYLYPLVDEPGEKEKIANQLKDLRNKVVFGFLMLNSMFILIVFLLQTQKDTLHIDWPLNYQANITYIPAFNEVVIKIVPLQLEPINLILAFFFMLILVIQFVAMLLHRFQTMSHILASTDLKVCTRGLKNLSGEAEVNKNAVKYAHELQKLKVDEVNTDANMDRQVARRPTIQLLEDRRQPKPKVKTLDVAFQRRYMSLSVDNSGRDTPVLGALRRFSKNPETLEALKRRASRHRLGSLSVTPNQSLTGSQISAFNQFQMEHGNPSDALKRKVSRHRLGFLPGTPSLSLTGSQRSAFKKLDKEFGTPSGSIRSSYSNSGFDDDGESTTGHRRIPFFPIPSGTGSSGSTKVRFENEGASIEDGTASMKRRLSRISEK